MSPAIKAIVDLESRLLDLKLPKSEQRDLAFSALNGLELEIRNLERQVSALRAIAQGIVRVA